MIIVPTDTPDSSSSQHLGHGQPRGRLASHGEVSYQNARVPLSNLLGARARIHDRPAAPRPGRIHHCMRWIACASARSTSCAGTPPPGSSPQASLWAPNRSSSSGSREPCGDQRCPADGASRAWKIESKEPTRARRDLSHQVLGRQNPAARSGPSPADPGRPGHDRRHPIAFWYAHERAARIYDGADEVHVEAVARRILRGYGIKLK